MEFRFTNMKEGRHTQNYRLKILCDYIYTTIKIKRIYTIYKLPNSQISKTRTDLIEIGGSG